jgi:hypothetical protein
MDRQLAKLVACVGFCAKLVLSLLILSDHHSDLRFSVGTREPCLSILLYTNNNLVPLTCGCHLSALTNVPNFSMGMKVLMLSCLKLLS